MTDDASRRDVLHGLAALGVVPVVPGADLDRNEPELPDVPDVDAIWLALSVAVEMDDAGEVLDSTEPVARLYAVSEADLSDGGVRELVRAAVRGDYTREQEQYIRDRAADALDNPPHG